MSFAPHAFTEPYERFVPSFTNIYMRGMQPSCYRLEVSLAQVPHKKLGWRVILPDACASQAISLC